MPNRTQEESVKLLLDALAKAGETGLSLDQVSQVLFGEGKQSNRKAKNLIKQLKAKGNIHSKRELTGEIFFINHKY